MSNNKDEVIKRNIEFMYGRGEKTALADPDKVSYTKSHKFDVKPDAIDEFTGEFEYLSPLYSCRVMLAGDTTVYPSFEHALKDYSAGGLDADSYYTRAPGAPPAGIAAAALSERDHITGSRSYNNYDGGQRPAKKRSRSRSPHQSRNGDEGGSYRRHGEGKCHQSSRHQQSSSRSRSRSPNRRDCEKRKYR